MTGAASGRGRQVLPGVYLLRGIGGCNVYYLADPQNPALVDAGLPFSGPRVVRAVQSVGGALPPPKWLLVTHYHVDHVGGAAHARRALGVSIVTHPAEAAAFVHRRQSGDGNGRSARLYTMRTKPDLLLEDGDVLPVLGGLEVVHTPGHTPGSLCFLLRSHGALFTGDLFVSYQDRLSRPFMGPESDGAAFAASLARVAALSPPALLPGHGYPVMRDAPTMLGEMATRRGASLGLRARVRNVPRLVRFHLGMWRDQDMPGPQP